VTARSRSRTGGDFSLVARDDGKFVLWPVYFDAKASRPWRRVARDIAVPDVRADEVARAAQALRMRVVLERDVTHPGRSREHGGRVLVDARGTKTVLVRQVGEKVKELREADPVAEGTKGTKGTKPVAR